MMKGRVVDALMLEGEIMRSLTCFIVLASVVTARADILTQWDFNTADGQFNTGTLAPSVGAGTIVNIGGTSSFFGFAGSSSDPADNSFDSAWGIGNLPNQGTGNRTAGFEALTSTVGYRNIRVSFDIRTQFSSSKYYAVQYRTSMGGPWIDAAVFGVATEDVWENQKTFDLSALDAGVENNASFGFRVVAAFKPGTNGYAGMNDDLNSYGRFGPLHDMVTVQAEVVPEPASLALLMAGSAWLMRRRRAR